MASATKSKAFTEYPQYADKYFLDREIIIPGIPASIQKEIESKAFETRVTSAKQYHDYLTQEIAFWHDNDPQNILGDHSHYGRLTRALDDFSQAISYYNSYPDYPSNGNSRMNQSINQVSGGHLCSKTKLAKFLVANKSKGTNFINGFMSSLSTNRGQGLPSSIDAAEGFIVGLEYAKIIKKLISPTAEEFSNFTNNLCEANENYSKLNACYTASFHDQEAKSAEFTAQIEEQIAQIKAKAENYFTEKEARCQELENLYEEKLKLQAPADYWDKLDKQYSKAGWWWFVFSILFTSAIVIGLVLTLKYLPNLFSKDSHWMDVFKNSAIITVITSIAVYVLRLFVKMTVSSFHLSRDARERNKLTYFYLSLIEKKAVTEKERAIILNSLFSRANTGLLKGDSSPTMSGNITDLVNSLSQK